MISEAVLIERCARLRMLEGAIEDVDAYLAARQQFHEERDGEYHKKKEQRIVNLRSKLERASEAAAEDYRLLIEELRETQDALRSIE